MLYQKLFFSSIKIVIKTITIVTLLISSVAVVVSAWTDRDLPNPRRWNEFTGDGGQPIAVPCGAVVDNYYNPNAVFIIDPSLWKTYPCPKIHFRNSHIRHILNFADQVPVLGDIIIEDTTVEGVVLIAAVMFFTPDAASTTSPSVLVTGTKVNGERFPDIRTAFNWDVYPFTVQHWWCPDRRFLDGDLKNQTFGLQVNPEFSNIMSNQSFSYDGFGYAQQGIDDVVASHQFLRSFIVQTSVFKKAPLQKRDEYSNQYSYFIQVLTDNLIIRNSEFHSQEGGLSISRCAITETLDISFNKFLCDDRSLGTGPINANAMTTVRCTNIQSNNWLDRQIIPVLARRNHIRKVTIGIKPTFKSNITIRGNFNQVDVLDGLLYAYNFVVGDMTLLGDGIIVVRDNVGVITPHVDDAPNGAGPLYWTRTKSFSFFQLYGFSKIEAFNNNFTSEGRVRIENFEFQNVDSSMHLIASPIPVNYFPNVASNYLINLPNFSTTAVIDVYNNNLTAKCVRYSLNCTNIRSLAFYFDMKNLNMFRFQNNFVNNNLTRPSEVSIMEANPDQLGTTISAIDTGTGVFTNIKSFEIRNNVFQIYLFSHPTRINLIAGLHAYNLPIFDSVSQWIMSGNKCIFSGAAQHMSCFGTEANKTTNMQLIQVTNNLLDTRNIVVQDQPYWGFRIFGAFEQKPFNPFTTMLIHRLGNQQFPVFTMNVPTAPNLLNVSGNSLISIPVTDSRVRGGYISIAAIQGSLSTDNPADTSMLPRFNPTNNFRVFIENNTIDIVPPSPSISVISSLFSNAPLQIVSFGSIRDNTSELQSLVIRNNRITSTVGGTISAVALWGGFASAGTVNPDDSFVIENNYINVTGAGEDSKTIFTQTGRIFGIPTAPRLITLVTEIAPMSSLISFLGNNDFSSGGVPLIVRNNYINFTNGYGSMAMLGCVPNSEVECVEGNVQLINNTIKYSQNPKTKFPVRVSIIDLIKPINLTSNQIDISVQNNTLEFDRLFVSSIAGGTPPKATSSFVSLAGDSNQIFSGAVTIRDNRFITSDQILGALPSSGFVSFDSTTSSSPPTSNFQLSLLINNNTLLIKPRDQQVNLLINETILRRNIQNYSVIGGRNIAVSDKILFDVSENPSCNRILFSDRFASHPDLSFLPKYDARNCEDYSVIELETPSPPTTTFETTTTIDNRSMNFTTNTTTEMPSPTSAQSQSLQTGTNVALGASMVFAAGAAAVVPSMGFGISRQQAMVSFVQKVRSGDCTGINPADADSIAAADSPTQMAVGKSVATRYVGGAIGNVVLTFGLVSIGFLLGMAFLKRTGSSMWNRPFAVFARCQVSMILFVCLSLFFAPSVKFGLVTVALNQEGSGIDVPGRILAIAFGVVIFGGVTFYFATWSLFIRERKEAYIKINRQNGENGEGDKRNWLQKIFDYWFEGPGEWRMPLKTSRAGRGVSEEDNLRFDAATPIIDGYQGHAWWFGFFEFVTQLGLAVAEFLANVVLAEKSCIAQAAALLVVLGVFLLLCIWKRPFQELFNRIVTPIITAFQMAVIAFAIAFGEDQPEFVVTIALMVASLQSAAVLVVLLVSLAPLGKQIIKVLKRVRKVRRNNKRNTNNNNNNKNLREVFRESMDDDNKQNDQELLERKNSKSNNHNSMRSPRQRSDSRSSSRQEIGGSSSRGQQQRDHRSTPREQQRQRSEVSSSSRTRPSAAPAPTNPNVDALTSSPRASSSSFSRNGNNNNNSSRSSRAHQRREDETGATLLSKSNRKNSNNSLLGIRSSRSSFKFEEL